MEQYDEEEEEEGILEVEDELMNYSFRLHNCFQEETLAYDDNGYPIYGVAIVRVCPSDSCNEKIQGGCKSGYADLAVPLSTYVEAYLQDQAEYQYWDDAVDVESFSQCSQYEGNDNYYVGPACSKDGMDIRMALYTDNACSSLASIDLSSDELPFSDGGIISNTCVSCGEVNGDDGSMDLTETCAELYEDSIYKCESWEISHYYWDAITEVFRFGQDTTGCKRIGWMDKSPEPFSEWASIFVLLLLVGGSAGGAYYYQEWWKERKSTLSFGSESSSPITVDAHLLALFVFSPHRKKGSGTDQQRR